MDRKHSGLPVCPSWQPTEGFTWGPSTSYSKAGPDNLMQNLVPLSSNRGTGSVTVEPEHLHSALVFEASFLHCVNMYACIRIDILTRIHIRIHICICVCVYASIHIYVYVYVYVCVYMYT